jgi:colanic acid/amylovoran biosynthesis protein
MKILITHFFSQKNKGDAAILSAMIAELRRVFAGAEISVTTTEPIDHSGPSFEGAPLIHSFFYHAIYAHKQTWKQLFLTGYVTSVTLLWSLVWRWLGVRINFVLTKELKKLILAYENADIVAPVGGGYLTGKNSLHGNMTILLHLHAIAIGLLLRKPTYLFSQSIGPFGNRFQEYISAKILNRVNIIFAREFFTVETLKKIGIKSSLVTETVDVAFLFKADTKQVMADYLNKNGINFDKPVVGITVKRFLAKPQQDLYETAIARLIDWLNDQNFQVVVVPQVTSELHNDDDRQVGRRIGKMIKSPKNCVILNENLSHRQIKGIYENMNWFVGTRMHSCIFALTAYVPTIGIQYEYKTGGTMKGLGLADWVIKMEDVTFDRLREKFTALMKNRDAYLASLRSNIPLYENQARKAAAALKEDYLLLNSTKK